MVDLWVHKYACFLPLTNLIRASPCLQRFVLEASHFHTDFERITSMRRTKKTVRRPYRCLEVVELAGYRGAICESKLIAHFWRCAKKKFELIHTCSIGCIFGTR